jgi:hypothetical protein
MNYDLALMALDGLARSPIRIGTAPGEVRISGEAAGLKELARLLLLAASAAGADDESGVELKPPVHVTADSLTLRITRTGS